MKLTCLKLALRTNYLHRPHLCAPINSLCSCGSSYIGRAKQRLSFRIREHLPIWFIRSECRSTRSSILKHLLDTCHPVSTKGCYPQIYLKRFLRKYSLPAIVYRRGPQDSYVQTRSLLSKEINCFCFFTMDLAIIIIVLIFSKPDIVYALLIYLC